MSQVAALPREGSDQVIDAVRAALAVPGVAAVRVEPDSADGLALLRLELVPGADEQDVARAVDEHLRRRAHSSAAAPATHAAPETGSGPFIDLGDAGQVHALPSYAGDGEPIAIVTSGRLPQSHRPATPPVSVVEDEPRLSTSRGTGAYTNRPRPWEAAPVVLPDAEEPVTRLGLDRVQVMTRGLDVTATVVLTDGGRQHTGVCEAAATTGGHLRSLATATAQALESATGGLCRFEIEAADVTSVAGQQTAVVVLSALSGRGTERLTGACPVGADTQRAVVKAVLAASNRRMSLQLSTR